MRKYLVLLILMLTLTSCTNKDATVQPETPSSDEVVIDNIIEDQPISLTTETVELVDVSDEYPVNGTELTFYTGIREGIPYVNIYDYLMAIAGSIYEPIIETDGAKLNVSYLVEVDQDIRQFVNEEYSEYKFAIDFDNYTVELNTVDFIAANNVETETNFFEGLKYVGYEYEDPKPVTLDLSKYHFRLHHEEDLYLIPLYLANYFFSGYGLDTYYNGQKVYAYDIYGDFMSNSEIFTNEDTLNDSSSISLNVKKETYNFLAFLFDYNYGLKDVNGVDSYYDVLSGYNILTSKSDSQFYNEISRFFLKLNDLHSSFDLSGYQESVVPNANGNTRINTFRNSYYANQCDLEAGGSITVTSEELDENTGYIQVFGFDETIKPLIETAMDGFKDKDNIVFDIRCNGGGILGTIYHPLKYMTNEGIPFTTLSPFDDAYGKSLTQADRDFYMDKNYYLVTSNVTFSAANSLTSIVKDNNYATIIGSKSGGGASPIYFNILPDGAVVHYSGPTIIVNENRESIEYGIDVDIPLEINKDTNIKQEILNIVNNNN